MTFVLSVSWLSCWYWVLTTLFLAEPVLLPGRRSRSFSRQGRFELVLIASSLLLGLATSATLDHLHLGSVEGSVLTAWRIVGLVVYGAGVALRYWSALTLGPWFTRDVEVRRHQELAEHGPYRWLRHPLYTGLLLVACGMMLLFGNVPGVLLGLGWTTAAVHRRVRREESLLDGRLGGSYRQWKIGRFGLLPPFV